jgi:hypothetical protein
VGEVTNPEALRGLFNLPDLNTKPEQQA